MARAAFASTSTSAAPLVLACDTTQGACSAALYRDGLLAAHIQEMRQGHAEALLPMMAELMDEAGVTPQDINRLAVTNGPGTFTGVRVGLAAMRGLALALKRPLKTYGTLHMMALATNMESGRHDGPVLVAVDAKRETFYAQAFDAARVPLGAAQALDGAACWRLVDTQNTIGLIGSGAVLLADAAAHETEKRDYRLLTAAPFPDSRITAAYAAQDENWADEDADPYKAEPLYLRAPDATLPDRSKFPARQKGA